MELIACVQLAISVFNDSRGNRRDNGLYFQPDVYK